jgi:histidyl-tRNA synthetase
MGKPLIQPRTLKGFRDFLPEAMIPRERMMEIARRVYRSYGFSPIDTPALEYLEILRGKGSDETDKQLYQFEDSGGRAVGMRFDLTVPLARFVAQHIGELGTPFKRYQIATVWRGENTQRGRYREFMQCDFDTIGTLSPAADAETALVIHDLLHAIGFEKFTIHINNRLVLSGFLEKLELENRAKEVLRGLDKLAKIGPDRVIDEIQQTAQATVQQARQLVALADLQGSNDQILRQLHDLVAGNNRGEEGVQRLADLLATVTAGGVATERLKLDPSIARGLDYYTGTVYETVLDDLPAIGSVASGGRYDSLAELYTNQQLPGVGASLGLDRLLAAMQELGMIKTTRTPAEVFVPYFDAQRLGDYLLLASQVRAAGFGVEVFPEPKKLGKQLQYADRRGFRAALIAGPDELDTGQCQVKDLAKGTSTTVPLDKQATAIITELRRLLAS